MADSISSDSAALVNQPSLSLVLERITDGFFALDVDWRFTYMNAEARKLLRVHGDIIGVDWLEAFPKTRGDIFEREFTRAMREQLPVQVSGFSTPADCWLECKAYPSVDGLSVYFRDDTTRIQAQREIERNVRRQQALIDFGRATLGGTSHGQLVADAIDLFRDLVDATVVEVYDYSKGDAHFTIREASGWETHAALDPAKPLLGHVFYAVRTGDAFVCSDVRIDPRARTLAPLAKLGVLSCICVPIGARSNPIGAIAIYSRDTRTYTVGDVRFAESVAQALAEASTAIETNRRMAQVLDSISDAFVAVDRDMTITYANERMAAYWDRSAADLVGKPVVEITREFGDGKTLDRIRTALETGALVTFEQFSRDRWYEIRLYPFSGGVAAYSRDITRRKEDQERMLNLNIELEHRVAERTKQLELANKELESFSYSVSHDLRAPLRAIDGFSQALVEDYEGTLDARGRDYLERVRRAAQRMADLIDALLRLARVARASIKLAPVDITTLAESIAADLREAEPERSVAIDVAPNLVATGDAHLMDAVLQNLMNNAWKFTRHAAAPRIQVGSTGEGQFFVRDNGAGFDMAYQNKLFGAFQRLHSTEDYEGTGIGLATVARIIHRHGGTITAQGSVGFGATFTFTLPTQANGAIGE